MGSEIKKQGIRNWTYQEGKGLIACYKNRKDEYKICRKKDIFWENVLTDLESMDVLVGTTTVDHAKSKWKSLYRSYKAAKDRGTGSTPSKFLYMDEMDDIFCDNPLIKKSAHVVSVGANPEPAPAPMSFVVGSEKNSDENDENMNQIEETFSTSAKVTQRTRKRKNNNVKPAESIAEIKKRYYEEIIAEKKEKRNMLRAYLEEKEKNKEKRHDELMQILRSGNSK